jgi:glycosyltransferase involved in cell wall biosynthesis
VRVCSPHCGLDPETTSGGETYERELLRHLAGQGMVIDLILARHQRVPQGVANWTVHRLPMGRGLRWPVAAVVWPPFIKRVFAETRFDLLRVHSLRFVGPAALMARRRYRLDVPVVSHHHHLDPSLLNPVIERRVIRGSERTITGSEFSKRQLLDELDLPDERVEVVPYGVDARFAPTSRDAALARRLGLGEGPIVLFLGGLKPRKNLPLLLEAWREVVAACPAATLLIAGSGPQAAALSRQAERLGLGLRVRFAGRVPESEKVAWYNLADVFVSPSSLEGFGFNVAEAMSCARPVVVSDRGSLPELVGTGERDLVCSAEDAPAFARALVRLLGDAPLRRRLGEANRQRIDREFRWERSSRRVAEIYEDVVAEWKRAPRASTMAARSR